MGRGRPRNNEETQKADRIIAKVCEQFSRWGFSGEKMYPIISEAALTTLRRTNKDVGSFPLDFDEDKLSEDSIEKIHKQWQKNQQSLNKDKYGLGFNNFSRRQFSKGSIQQTAPEQKDLKEVAVFLMEYMNTNPEKCIFTAPPESPHRWRFYNGELDGDPVLAPKAQERINLFPKIKNRVKK